MEILCIGTTGMLAGCVRSLIADADRVIALARSRSGLDALRDLMPPDLCDQLILRSCDYRALDEFRRVLGSLESEPTAAICWVHEPAAPVLSVVKSVFPKLELLWVVGSATQSPFQINTDQRLVDRVVRLGFIIEDDRSRWLTHDEISRGVYRAFRSGERESLVGIIEPWDKRPR